MSATAIPRAPAGRGGKDIGFAVGIVLILCLFFFPVPATMIDFGLALSIALSVLILMVGFWIHKPTIRMRTESAIESARPKSIIVAGTGKKKRQRMRTMPTAKPMSLPPRPAGALGMAVADMFGRFAP